MLFPRLNIADVRALWRPAQIAGRITDRVTYGTPATDRFFPEAVRREWPDVTVPVEKITRRTRAVPVVLRGAPGVTIAGDSGAISLIVPQPVKTLDGFTAADYNNRRLYGQETVQAYADEITDRHIDTHRLTREALCAQSLTGRIDFPISGAQGQIVDAYSIQFGAVHTFVPTVDWTGAATIGAIHKELTRLRTERTERGYGTTEIYVGGDLFAALVDKVSGIHNDTRVTARMNEDGTVQIGALRLTQLADRYDHPGLPDFGQPGGAVAAGPKSIIGGMEVMAVDRNAGFQLLSVRLDNFKLPPNPGVLGAIVEMSRDGGMMDLFFESKPFPIAPAAAISRFYGDDTQL